MTRIARLLAALMVVGLLTLTACSTGSSPTQPESGPGNSGPITVAHTQGETVLPNGPAQRIAVTDLGSLDTIKALGLADRVVALPKSGAIPDALAEFKADKYIDLGTMQDINLEKMNQANPDLVIVGFRSAAKYPEFAKTWPTIDITYTDVDVVTGTIQAAKVIGTALGATQQAEAKSAELQATADGLKGIGQGRSALIVMTSGGKATLHGENSRFGAVHQLFGFSPAVPAIQADSHGQPASFEAIAQANPDVMFIIDRDVAVGQQGQPAAEVLNNELINNTNAAKNGKLVYLDGGRWYVIIHGLDNVRTMLADAGAQAK
ncbi:siderophore ABC transporter substrate-binding protein [Granulicoccus phenolivorans]|uniref:siderophore ABC transporter substrate-binding protein n=1 Tax=Granulicoccus phenolivorans TaxID=266854 RepID=UPI0004149518|nr:ABC transporter substrate-binding protein [Granulicoccus phenolivorans]